MQEKVRKKLIFANKTPKPPDPPDRDKPMQNWSNPPEIRQKLGARQKSFLPARRLSIPPELSKSGGENRHLATVEEKKTSEENK
jgi:hypothetical protein